MSKLYEGRKMNDKKRNILVTGIIAIILCGLPFGFNYAKNNLKKAEIKKASIYEANAKEQQKKELNDKKLEKEKEEKNAEIIKSEARRELRKNKKIEKKKKNKKEKENKIKKKEQAKKADRIIKAQIEECKKPDNGITCHSENELLKDNKEFQKYLKSEKEKSIKKKPKSGKKPKKKIIYQKNGNPKISRGKSKVVKKNKGRELTIDDLYTGVIYATPEEDAKMLGMTVKEMQKLEKLAEKGDKKAMERLYGTATDAGVDESDDTILDIEWE